ncbi:GLPGLI family protein [Bizionia paragorgiae]|uniref:GLPGLI family protein n=1 Tax=Bizionia paragorgiae TaxID=283786 RepID=A0A1H4BPU0_BIZPA|nr:GLPGLI family protein [Bizionia paragorgiae]SEA50128.1 GLPGLI family protein [Bizionia paragorgiae]
MNDLHKKIIKTAVVCFAIFASTLTMAQQDFQGVATYQSKTTIDLDKWGGDKMSPERKKMIMERMKSMFEKTFMLTFNRTESIYKEDEKLAAPGAGGGGFRGMMGSFTAGAQYKNVKEGQFLQDQEFFGKQFLINDELEKLEWKMTGETKQIGQYMCMKAVATKKVDDMDFSNMRRRDRNKDDDKKGKDSSAVAKADEPKDMMDEIEIPEEIEVVAWYTMQIPVNQGPGEFWGLPGLILEVSSGRTTVLCSKIVLNPDEKTEIKKPSKGKVVTKQEYADIVKQKVEEMREMYGGRNRGGFRH